MGAWATPFRKLSVEAEQEALLATLGAALHPLTLRHQLYFLIRPWNVHGFRDFLDFDNFFAAILREENT